MGPSILRLLPFLALLILAAGCDLRRRRIPNAVSFLLILGGIAHGLLPEGRIGLPGALAGLVVGAAIPFAMFAIGALGAGDVKLMAGVGAWLGPLPALAVFAAAGVIGMGIVLVQAGAQKRFGILCRNSVVVALNLAYIRQVGAEHATRTGLSARSVDRPLPYAVPVLFAVLLVIGTIWGMR